jgi:hypothetical protein
VNVLYSPIGKSILRVHGTVYSEAGELLSGVSVEMAHQQLGWPGLIFLRRRGGCRALGRMALVMRDLHARMAKAVRHQARD